MKISISGESLSALSPTQYDAFLRDQKAKEREVWKRCLPDMLMVLTEVIQTHPCKNDPEWTGKSLPELRVLYASCKRAAAEDRVFDGPASSYSALDAMCKIVNGWNLSSGVFIKGSKHMDPKYYGKAAIADDFSLIFVNANKGSTPIPVPDAMKAIAEKRDGTLTPKDTGFSREVGQAPIPGPEPTVPAKPAPTNRGKAPSTFDIMGVTVGPTQIANMKATHSRFNKIDSLYLDKLVVMTDPKTSRLAKHITSGPPAVSTILTQLVGVKVFVGLWV